MNNSTIKYLKSGPQTKITEDVKKISESFVEKRFDLIFEILKWIHSNFISKPFDKKIFRKRTAQEIIKSRMLTGCTDYALVFIILSRTKGIPTKYVETINKDWLNSGGKNIEGHIFAECFVDNKWYIVNPQQGSIQYAYKRYIVFKKGLDSWNIGIKDYDVLEKQFAEFRKKYKRDAKRIN